MLEGKSKQGNTLFALDIGTRSVIGLIGAIEKDRIHIQHMVIEFHKKRAMYDGQIHDIEGVVEVVKSVKGQLEERVGHTLHEVAIAAAGRALKTHRITIEREIPVSKEIDQNLLSSLEIEGLQRSQNELEEGAREGTAYYCVGHSVVNYYLNGGLITNPLGHRGEKLEIDLIATFLPQIVVDSLYTVMAKAGLEVSYMTLEPIAAIGVAVPQNVRLLNIALVDIGAGTSDIAITREGSIIAYGMVPIAGDEITEAIAKNYLLDFDSAEALKCRLSKEERLQFMDIVGMEYVLKREEILSQIQSVVDNLAKEIANQMLSQNGKAPSAVFLIGGGSQLPGLNEAIAQHLNLPKERVVVRGTEMIQNLVREQLVLTGPEGITPIGILCKAIENKKNDFMMIRVNDREVKLLQSRTLKVSDALVMTGFSPRNLIPQRGASITIGVNGQPKTIYGDHGEPAQILVNERRGSLDTTIKGGDVIRVIPAQGGKDAQGYLKDVVPLDQWVKVNGQKLSLYYDILVNGKSTTEDQRLEDGDQVEFKEIHRIIDLCQFLQIDERANGISLEGKPVDPLTPLYHGANISIAKRTGEQDFKAETIRVYYNDRPLSIEKKKNNLIFVDIFDYIDFDRSKVQGKLILKHNGFEASYTHPLEEGDRIEIYWEGT